MTYNVLLCLAPVSTDSHQSSQGLGQMEPSSEVLEEVKTDTLPRLRERSSDYPPGILVVDSASAEENVEECLECRSFIVTLASVAMPVFLEKMRQEIEGILSDASSNRDEAGEDQAQSDAEKQEKHKADEYPAVNKKVIIFNVRRSCVYAEGESETINPELLEEKGQKTEALDTQALQELQHRLEDLNFSKVISDENISDENENVLECGAHNNMERELKIARLLKKKGQEAETLYTQSMKKFRDSVKDLILSNAIADEKKVDILEKTTSLAHEVVTESQKGVTFEDYIQKKAQGLQKKGDVFVHKPEPKEALQPPDLSEIPLWRGRRQDGMPLDFIKTHYGKYLSAFGAEQDKVFQDQIGARDPKLMRGVRNQLYEEDKDRKISDFVKTRSTRLDKELENTDPEYIRNAIRLSMASIRRKHKA